MSYTKNFVLKQSIQYIKRLDIACSRYYESKYKNNIRKNWTYKFDNQFLSSEYEIFSKKPDIYLSGSLKQDELHVKDIYHESINSNLLIRVLFKILIHWVFRIISKIHDVKHGVIYRKCYVDDIDSVYSDYSLDVCKWIYPFPIGAKRQINYIKKCIKENQNWKFAGLPYGIIDAYILILKRDFHSYIKLETRAQIRHGQEISKLNYKKIEISDEFEIGSLNFTLTARRYGLFVENCAHGIGAYLPVHAYNKFKILTKKQSQYYQNIRKTNYEKYSLAIRIAPSLHNSICEIKNNNIACLIASSLSYKYEDEVELNKSEIKICKFLADMFKNNQNITLFYRPHPNNANPIIPNGFQLAPNIETIDWEKTVIISFNSTIHIDPTYKGIKILVKDEGLYPEIMFGDDVVALNKYDILKTIERLL
jgi:hypothetical protein